MSKKTGGASPLVQRCILATTAPGDLVLDPTCGSGTSAYVAEQWGRRWITIDTSRVALALARARIMGARYPYYLLADSSEGQRKEAEITRKTPSEAPTHGDVRQGFVYERVPHITLKSLANNAEIDVIWERWQETLEPLRDDLNSQAGLPTGRSGRFPARRPKSGQRRRPRRIDSGGRRASLGSGRSTLPSRPGPTTSTSTTSPTRTTARCGWRVRSRWRACRRIACWG